MAQLRGPTVEYSARGNPIYEVRVEHAGLGESHLIRSSDEATAVSRARAKATQLDQRFARQTSLQRSGKQAQMAQELTQEAEARLAAIEGLLIRCLNAPNFSWAQLKDRTVFNAPPPRRPTMPAPPPKTSTPTEPKYDSFLPEKTFVNKLFPSTWGKIGIEAKAEFDRAHLDWERTCDDIRTGDAELRAQWAAQCTEIERQHEANVEAWVDEKSAHERRIAQQHERVATAQAAYADGRPAAVKLLADAVVARIDLPDCFPGIHECAFDPTSGMLIMDLWLPAPADLPDVKEFKFIKSREVIEEKKLAANRSAAIFENLGYQTALLIPQRIFAADTAKKILAITFNGRVVSIDRATGKHVDVCILSLQAKRQEFVAVNLESVEPKACFKKMKGVAASRLHAVTPVPPLLSFSKDDQRFSTAYEVAGTLEEGENLAAMDWEDFEHLIREMFEAEFKATGAEVRVTRASRDGGVDAVIFDPDPLRGGKIVVQAKRYTNTVGPSAVRDLFGAVQHEGANKGIIVTTASFGPDAYEFAKGKPLVLIDGGGLLALLEKHGHKVRIDLAEARALAMQ